MHIFNANFYRKLLPQTFTANFYRKLLTQTFNANFLPQTFNANFQRKSMLCPRQGANCCYIDNVKSLQDLIKK